MDERSRLMELSEAVFREEVVRRYGLMPQTEYLPIPWYGWVRNSLSVVMQKAAEALWYDPKVKP